MGTTITAAIVDAAARRSAIGHVGDSRAYRLRDGKLERSPATTRSSRRCGARASSPTPRPRTTRSARSSPARSAPSRGRGRPADRPGRARRRLPALLRRADDDDRRGADRAAVLAGADSLKAAVRSLVDEANRAGGRDNITVLAFRLEDASAPQREPEGATLIGPSGGGRRPDRDRGPPPGRRRRAPGSGASELAARAGPRRRPADVRPRRSRSLVVARALVAYGAWYGLRQVWFLGTDQGGRVALYRGLPYDLPFGDQALRRALLERRSTPNR